MPPRELWLLSLIGFSIWLSGAVTFRFGGHMMFETGTAAVALSAFAIAMSVCLLLRAVMDWRKVPIGRSVLVAVVMTLPGLFGDVVYVTWFHALSGLRPATAATYAGVVIFGTAVLYLYALVRAAPDNAG
jgi:hypothetical protein